jgi:hypothetical protein
MTDHLVKAWAATDTAMSELPITAAEIGEVLRSRRRFLAKALADVEPYAAELATIDTALLALGQQDDGARPATILVCDYCGHIPFATQRALTRHLNKTHPAVDMSQILAPDEPGETP